MSVGLGSPSPGIFTRLVLLASLVITGGVRPIVEETGLPVRWWRAYSTELGLPIACEAETALSEDHDLMRPCRALPLRCDNRTVPPVTVQGGLFLTRFFKALLGLRGQPFRLLRNPS